MGIILILTWGKRLVALSALVMVTSACSVRDENESAGRRDIVVTTDILGDLVNRMGTGGDVTVLIPSGTDAHEFEPSARQIARLREADVVVANPPGYEEHLTDVLGDLDPDRLVQVEVERDDPHWWMDPVLALEVVEDLADDLDVPANLVPAAALEKAHDDVTAILDTVEPGDRKLVTDHDVLGYFADRYDFEVVGAVVPSLSSQASSSAEQIAALATTMGEQGVDTVFVGTAGSDRLARALARELGGDATVVRLPGESLGKHASYEAMIVDVATRIAEALG
jgi:zinc/manganese transport system substrate-binding protein